MRENHKAIAEIEEFANRPVIDIQPSLWLSKKLSLTADATTNLQDDSQIDRQHLIQIKPIPTVIIPNLPIPSPIPTSDRIQN